MIKAIYDLDMTPMRTLPIIINVSQYDDLGRTLVFNLFSSSGKWTAPTSAAVTFEGGKPDGKFFAYSCAYSNGTVTVIIQQQMTAVAGKVRCKIKVTSGDKVVESAPIIMVVDAAAVPDGSDMSKSDINDAVANATQKIVDQVKDNIPSDYTQLSTDVSSLKINKVDKPLTTDDGRIPRAKSGGVEWVELGQPTDEQTNSAVKNWLNEHPEATTTVQDESLTEKKFTFDLQKKKASYYNSVNEMKSDLSLKNGMTAITLGYYTKGDFGGGTYYIRQRTKTDNETLGDVFIGDNLTANLLLCGQRKYNVSQLGIVPNTGDDLSDKFQKVLNTKVHNAEFYFPSGTYEFKKPIILKQVTTLIGDMFIDSPSLLYDTNGTTFRFTGSLFSNNVCIDGATTAESGRNKIVGIKFISDSFSVSEDRNKILTNEEVYTTNINFENVSCVSLKTGSTIKNCVFNGFSGYCVKLSGAFCLLTQLVFTNCNIGLNTFIDNRFISLRFNLINIGFILDGSANILDDIRMDSVSQNAILCQKAVRAVHNTITNIFVDFCYKTPFILGGSYNFISTEIGRCCAKHHDKKATEISDDELNEASAICFHGGGLVNNGNRIICVMSQSNVLDADKVAIAPPIFLSVLDGEFNNNNIDITCNIDVKAESILSNDLERKLTIIRLHSSPEKYIKLDSFKIAINNIVLNTFNCYIMENSTEADNKLKYFSCNKFSINNMLVNYNISMTPVDAFMFMRDNGKLYISDVVDGVLSWTEV